jgi:hypothetical protein
VCFTRNNKRAKDEQISNSPYLFPLLRSLTVTSVMLERIEKFKHFFTTFLAGGIRQGQGRGILECTLRHAYCGGVYSLPRGSRQPGSAARRWGVVQLVGHLTVNEDGEGSNPSAPANSLPTCLVCYFT